MKSVIAWSWTQPHRYQRRYQRAIADPANAQLEFVRLQAPGQVTALIARVRAQAAAEVSGETWRRSW